MRKLTWLVLIILLMFFFVNVYTYDTINTKIYAINEFVYSVYGHDPVIMTYYQLPDIKIADYEKSNALGILNEDEQKLFLDILEAVDKGETEVHYQGDINYYNVLTHLAMYYGSEERVTEFFSWSESKIYLNQETFDWYKLNKVIIESRVDEMLSMLKEGSDEFKLFQISAYLAERIFYDLDFREPLDGLNGKGVCSTYAMLFYKAASRIGIETYICYGYIEGEYHAWNMVRLDDEYYFYDITWFDGGIYDFSYLHSPSGWDRQYTINNVWGDIKT